LGALAFATSGPAFGQGWRAGASVGLVNDVADTFRLDEFHNHDVNVWIDFLPEAQVAVRATFGSLKVKGTQSGAVVSVTPGAPPTALPEFSDRINYATLGVSYEFWEGEYTTGIFAGIGGYRVEPDSVDAAIQPFQDPSQTVFGWHGGVDGSFRIVSRLSLLVRFTYHGTTVAPRRRLLTANAGFLYSF
jgi:hypothetical protein